MRKNFPALLSKTIDVFPENMMFLITGAVILILPAIATTGQFLNTGYFLKTIPVLLFYWPGADSDVRLQVTAWIFMGLVFVSFIMGIAYMLRMKTLGKVILITILIFICSILLRALLSSLFGWSESPLPDLSGKANSTIIALWHNPIWEEIVFRGIPLLILLLIEKYITRGRTTTGVILYCIIPSVLCGLYHIPGHGLIRFFDTLVIGSGFALMTLRFSFFAPVVMHYIADAMMVMNLNKVSSIQPSEVTWIIQYGASINTLFFMLTLFLIALIPVLMIYYYIRERNRMQLQTV